MYNNTLNFLISQAAGSVVFSLCSPDLEQLKEFVYINNCFPSKPSHHIEDTRYAAKLWQVTNKLLESKIRL